MLINVTARDIKYGKPRRASCCPVARAMKRRTKHRVEVGQYTLIIRRDDGFTRIRTPIKVRAFINGFDGYTRSKDYTPFTFEVPDEFLA